ncbi:hypothetical protein N7478_008433 [Penicillium angulare]|uniref:uncharacterized protein n=1 Tax=Penicillium angulare TaxID=116970 RepID=UPI002542016E|nr:uncharacterized protein N7478_008433 [Penicillium angulare]KAJ5273308.1 hypothetical protein N7478_008433 [Penicillium angulare]
MMFEATIRFRWEAALLADYLVEIFRLPVPKNEICIMWYSGVWFNATEKKFPASEFIQRWSDINATLNDSIDLPAYHNKARPFTGH